MMCARLLRHETKPNLFFRILEGAFRAVERGYGRALGGALRLRILVVVAAVAVAALGGYFLTHLKSELSPTEDRGTVSAFGTAPEGASIAYTERYAKELEKILAEVPRTAASSP